MPFRVPNLNPPPFPPPDIPSEGLSPAPVFLPTRKGIGMGRGRRLCWVGVEMVSRRWHAHPLLLTEIPTQAHLPEIPLGRSQESPNPTPGSLGKGWLYSCLSSP